MYVCVCRDKLVKVAAVNLRCQHTVVQFLRVSWEYTRREISKERSILMRHKASSLSEHMPGRCLSIYIKLINSSCSPGARGVRQCTEIYEALTRSLGIGSSHSTQTPVHTCTYLLLHLCNDRRDIITRVYLMTFMDGLQMKKRE